jgi:uncharacterized protein (TIGR02265 family)
MFEAVFDWSLQPTGAFADALVDVGYVASRPELNYPSTTWRAALEVARRFAFADCADDAAWLELGRACSRGWFHTPLGPVFTEILPVLPPRAFFSRLEAYARLGRTDTRVTVLELLGDRVSFRHEDPVGVDMHFTQGALEHPLKVMGLRFEGHVEGTAHEHVVSFRWRK